MKNFEKSVAIVYNSLYNQATNSKTYRRNLK